MCAATLLAFNGIRPTIDDSVTLMPGAVITGDVVIGAHSSVWCHSVIRGDVHSIRIGAYTNVQDLSMLHVSGGESGAPLVVGDFVTIGHRVILHGCTIGHYCLIGMGAIVLDRAVIADEVMIGAGSVVPPNKVLASGYLYMGSPAKAVRPLTESEKAFLRQSAQGYAQTALGYQEPLMAISSKMAQ
jgi:carbonic anhydrase/acetyltransferase-like protein (isoleucine patch superfamily)